MYERTFLNKIKIDGYLKNDFDKQPRHIDRLFENEDEYLGIFSSPRLSNDLAPLYKREFKYNKLKRKR